MVSVPFKSIGSFQAHRDWLKESPTKSDDRAGLVAPVLDWLEAGASAVAAAAAVGAL